MAHNVLDNEPRTRRSKALIVAFALTALIMFIGFVGHPFGAAGFASTSYHAGTVVETFRQDDRKLHILLSATDPNPNLCKTLLTSTLLGYPQPVLVAWNETSDTGFLLGGGSHVLKIVRVLEWLEALDKSNDDDLVMLMDAYDIWFQLPPAALVQRYNAINSAANSRIQERMGKTAQKEGISQTIVFGAGKRCAPNQAHTVACYPLPDSPLPDDLYGSNTDTIIGRNKYYSTRQRYLNSGYVIGPAKDMRAMFERARALVKAHKEHDPNDNGSGGSDFMYHGSDQSIFATMFGHQEYQREVLRRKGLSWTDRVNAKNKPHASQIEGTVIDDPLNPSFTHEKWSPESGERVEYGMGLDYASDLGHQTINSERDAWYLHFNQSVKEQVASRLTAFDCPSRVTQDLASKLDIYGPPLSSQLTEGVSHDMTWQDVSLYTHMCFNTAPVMIHHNGDKSARERHWPRMWLQRDAKVLFDTWTSVNAQSKTIVSTDRRQQMEWKDMCSAAWDEEIFRSTDKQS